VTPYTDLKTQDDWAAYAITTSGIDAEDQLWRNPLNPHALRLTKEGFVYLSRSAKIKFHECTLIKGFVLSAKILLLMQRYIHSPYYIKSLSTLLVVDDQLAVMLHLHSGDLEQYLTNQQISNLD